MTRILLLALIAAPLMSGCDAENTSSSQSINNSQTTVPSLDSASSDIGPTSDTSGPSVSVVNTTISEMKWETYTYICTDGLYSVPDPPHHVVATGVDPNPRIFVSTVKREEWDEGWGNSGPASTGMDGASQRILADGTLETKCGRIGDIITITLGY